LTDEQDRAAVQSVLAGEVDAFEGIVERWQGPLVNLAYRFCRDRELALEMAQDAFVRIYRALGSWRGDAKFSTWMFAVALNVFRSRLKRARVLEVPLDALDGMADSRFVDREFEAQDRAELVRRAVLALPGKYRDALVLFYFHEQSVEETARTLGVPEGTVKAQLSRGRGILRHKLAGLFPPDEMGEA
jgi:RNA polymerase sigma-70 factor (ECF subfamily)